MAKELPYYKHEPSEWLEGEIQVCSDEAIVCFTNLRDGYWLKLGCMTYAFALQKYCRRNTSIIQELINNGIIDIEGDNIKIRFLDKQLNEFNELSEKRSKSANKRWNNAKEMQVHSKSNAIREDKSKEDNTKKEINNIEDRKLKFAETLKDFVPVYGRDMIKEFYDYWSEPNVSNSKFKKELQRTWSTELRLKTWSKNNDKFKSFKNGTTNNKPNMDDRLKQAVERLNSTGSEPMQGFGGQPEPFSDFETV